MNALSELGKIDVNTLPVVRKAYQIDLEKINEGYLFDNIFSCKESRGKCRSDLLSQAIEQGLEFRWGDEEMTYTNLPVIRYPELDLFLFEGEQRTANSINQILSDRERDCELQAILDNPEIEFCYIMKRGEYYRPNSCGYTGFKIRAGVYTKHEAVSDGRSCSDLHIVPINPVEHNDAIEREIQEMASRLINPSVTISETNFKPNQMTFKISGQPRKQLKKELNALKCSVRYFWQYNEGEQAEELYSETCEQITKIERELLEVI